MSRNRDEILSQAMNPAAKQEIADTDDDLGLEKYSQEEKVEILKILEFENIVIEPIRKIYNLTKENSVFFVKNLKKAGRSKDYFHKFYTFHTKDKEIAFDAKKTAALRQIEASQLKKIFVSKILQELGFGLEKHAVIIGADLFTITCSIIRTKKIEDDINPETDKRKVQTLSQIIEDEEFSSIRVGEGYLYRFAALDVMANLLELSVNAENLIIENRSKEEDVNLFVADFDLRENPNYLESVQKIFGSQAESKILLEQISYSLGNKKQEIAKEIFNKLNNGKKDPTSGLQKPSFLKAVENAYIYTAKLENKILEKNRGQQTVAASQNLEKRTVAASPVIKKYKEEIENRFKVFKEELSKIITPAQVSSANIQPQEVDVSYSTLSERPAEPLQERPATSLLVRTLVQKFEGLVAAKFTRK